jgi:SAM-dependent methyltransferase
MAGNLQSRRCLLLSSGDNNGALNYQFRAAGGRWTWADREAEGIDAMEELLGEKVHLVEVQALPFDDRAFDLVIVIDVHEHLADVEAFNHELARIVAPGGRVLVTTPNGDPTLPLARLKHWLGMTPAAYGHVVQGFSVAELGSMLEKVGLRPEKHGAYSRFFTEAVELAINFTYVKILARQKEDMPKAASIAPNTEERLRQVRKTYRAYSLVYPIVLLISCLDVLIPGSGGYAVAVTASKPG